MKLLIVFLISVTPSFSQNFEGKIIYQSSYKSKIPNLPDGQLTLMMGSTMEYFIKGGNYKSASNGTLLQWQVYINKDNKLYNKMSNAPALLWNDGAVNPDEVLNAVINRNVIDILGYSCDELILTCRTGMQKYYFTTKLKVDPGQYEKHKFGNWSEYISRAKSLPLKMIIENAQFLGEFMATSVEPLTLDDNLFKLPPDSKLEKSPF